MSLFTYYLSIYSFFHFNFILPDVISEQHSQHKKKSKGSDNSSSDSDGTVEKATNENLRFKTGQATFLTEKHVHWEDEADLSEVTEEKPDKEIKDEEENSVESGDSDGSADNEESSGSDSEDTDSQKQKRTSQKQKQKSIPEHALSQKEINSSDNGLLITQNVKEEEKIASEEKEKKEKKEKEKEEEEPGKFDGVFSDSEEEESSDEEEDEEDFSLGVDDFITAAKQRKSERDAGKSNYLKVIK